MTCKITIKNEGPTPHVVVVYTVEHNKSTKQTLAAGEACEVTLWDSRNVLVSEIPNDNE